MSILIREMVKDDIYRGFLDCLNQLSEFEISIDKAKQIFEERKSAGIFTAVAMQDNGCSGVLGTASVLIEPKFLKGGRNVGHIEDVVVDEKVRGSGIGQQLMDYLIQFCIKNRCYKVILNCSNKNIPFYENLEFVQWENQMRLEL